MIYRFLLLEENSLDADVIKATLDDGGIDCELLRVQTQPDFITALSSNVFDLILADYALSSFDGFSALSITHTQSPEVPFIFVCGSSCSGEVEIETLVETLKNGATDFVFKQRLERLVPSVQRALQQAQEQRKQERAELMLVEQKQLLELIALGQSLDECLTAVCASISKLNPCIQACFLLTDAHQLNFKSSIIPAFAPSFAQGLKDVPINDLCFGTCGTAVYSGQPISCVDIANDERWSLQWRDLCIAHNIKACHSTPVLGLDSLPLGSLMLCFDEARTPTDWEHQLASFGSHVASIVFERDRLNLALRENEARLRTVAANLPNAAVFIVDANLRYVLAEGQALLGAGVTSVDLVGKTLWEALEPNLAIKYEPLYRQALAGETFCLEHCSHSRDYISHGTPLYNSHGEVEAVLAVSYDISDRKRAELALRQSDAQLKWQVQRFNAVVSAVPDFIYMFNLSGCFLDVNKPLLDLLQKTLPEVIGKNFFELDYPPDLASKLQNQIQEVIDTRQPLKDEAPFTSALGTRAYEYIFVPIFNSEGAVEMVAGVTHDITEYKTAEIEREQLLQQEQAAREAAEQANRIKDEFLAVLSHELRSPLNPILGWTNLLQKGKLNAASQAKALETIERNAKLQAQLVEDLLDISRIMQGKLSLNAKNINLALVIEAALETVRLAAEAKNIQITLDLDCQPCSISGDAARLQQVLWNLLTNAVKFTPQGGQVTVELRQVESLAQLRVIDTGKGINPQFLPYVFEYFRQEDSSTTRKFGGLGLGLAIVRQIVEMHGGTVRVESPGENQGATFIVQLPALQPAMPYARDSVQERTQTETPLDNLQTETPLDNLQILLVDNDTDTREFQAFLLTQSGAQVTAVASAFEALQALDRFLPDILVSDIGMEQMDGYMLMREIRLRSAERGGTIPALAVTAYAGEANEARVLQAGFQKHLTKPLDLSALVATITQLITITASS
jgi:PAS domain S-box-containing protein